MENPNHEWFNSALILLRLGPSPDRTSLAGADSDWSRLSLVWSGIADPALAQPKLYLDLTILPEFAPG